MTVPQIAPGLIEVVAFTGASSRAYLRAVFQAYRTGRVVLALPPGSEGRTVPGTKILDRQSFEDDPGWFEERLDLIDSDAPAQIVFSSGTTGRPKALLLTHRALSDVVARINDAMRIDDSIREYIGVPVTFSFGFGRARAVAAAGGRAYLPPNGFDPAEIGRMLAAGEINAISAVPTLWRVLLANASVIGDAGPALRWIEIGSQYMSGAEKDRLKTLFPNARIVQHYGLTEASRATLLDVSATEGAALESVGRATGRCEVSVSETGLIRLRGPHLAEGIVSGAGVKPLLDADGWLTTSDRGRIEDGLLYFEGRDDELINCGGLKIDPTHFEQQLGQSLGRPDAVAVGRLADPMRGEQVLVATLKGAGLDADAVRQAARQVAESHGLAGTGALRFRTVSEIPKTATGKVQRAALADLPDLADPAPTPAVRTSEVPTASGTGDPRAAELQALWAEVLGVREVSLHESFYDLGGDSLSALTVIMRMESLGLEPETARMIFDGRTIAEIIGVSATPAEPGSEPAAAAPVPTASGTGDPRAAELQALWAEVLGVREVSLHESFYDLGGDSLSALTVIMRMESLGLEPETARMIFDGRTIAEIIAADGGTGAPSPGTPVSASSGQQAPFETVRPAASDTPAAVDTMAPGGLSFAEMMNAVHGTRGVLILWVVVVHWLPGVLERISQDAIWIYDALLYPALRYGTPGFAMVFGLGVGALGVQHYSKNPEQFRRANRFNIRLILGGVLFMALFRLATLLTGNGQFDSHLLSYLFYSAVAYYALAMLTMPLLMRILHIGPDRLLAALAFGAACMALHEILAATIAPLRPGGLLELIKILLSAKYGYFHMTSYVMIGVAMGILLRRFHASPRIARNMTLYGAAMIVFGAVMLYEVRGNAELTDFGLVQPWHLLIYAGVTLWIIAAFCGLNRGGGGGHPGFLRYANAFAIASGILALPIFVGHEVVIPAKSFLVNIGVPVTLALLVPLGIFLSALGIGYRRLLKFLVY